MIHAILQVARGLVRPLTTGALVGAFIAATFLRLLPAEALQTATALVLGWWFAERIRKSRRDASSDDSEFPK